MNIICMLIYIFHFIITRVITGNFTHLLSTYDAFIQLLIKIIWIIFTAITFFKKVIFMKVYECLIQAFKLKCFSIVFQIILQIIILN